MSASFLRWGVVVGVIAASTLAQAQPAAPEIVQIDVASARSADSDTHMVTAIYKPDGEGRWPVLIYSHGRSGSEADRRRTKPPDPRG
ncbi:MAG TPA: hypothetical protein VFN86_00215, partial [Casimicrobiaceae bacterium]|nr:hypothetical protein [Casimicrobiaceae bacterium]